MTCAEFVELVTAYLEGTLSAEERAAFDEHMALCPGCDRYLDHETHPRDQWLPHIGPSDLAAAMSGRCPLELARIGREH